MKRVFRAIVALASAAAATAPAAVIAQAPAAAPALRSPGTGKQDNPVNTPSNTEARLPPLDVAKLDDFGKSVHAKLQASASQVPYAIKDDAGNLIGMYRVMAYAPEVGEGITQLGSRWITSKRLTRRMQEIAILSTAAAGKAEYVWYAHERFARALLTPDEIAGLRERRPLQLADAREQVVHDVTRAVLDTGDVDDALYRRGVDVLGFDGLTELIWIIGIYQIDTIQLKVHRLGVPAGVAPPFAK